LNQWRLVAAECDFVALTQASGFGGMLDDVKIKVLDAIGA
jgi:hypothetical protein